MRARQQPIEGGADRSGALGRAATILLVALAIGTSTSPTGLASTQETAADTAESTPDLVAAGDRAWTERGAGGAPGRARPETIDDAVAAYTEALNLEPDDLVVRGKLLRALHYLGDYATEGRDAKLALFTRGQELGEAGLEQVAARLGGRESLDALSPSELSDRLGELPGLASVYYWTSVHWGLWGRHRGTIAAARQGVASKIRDYAERAIALDERLENAGGHRMLGQLNAEAPKIPLFTGWIDRRLAVVELRRAVELFPDDLLSRFYLADALIRFEPGSREEGLAMLRDIPTRDPNPGWLVEEMSVIRDAEARLAELAR